MTWLLAIELHWECHTGVLPPDALDLPISQESHYTLASAASPWLRLGRSKMFRSTLRSGALTFGCVLASALGSTAGAELLNHKDLSASIAITIAQTAIETCKANGYAVSATVVGRNGEIIVQVRGDNTGPHTLGHLEKFFSPSPHESDSVTARGNGRMERASHGAEGLFRC